MESMELVAPIQSDKQREKVMNKKESKGERGA
jgi:hypothetical protein